MKNLGVIKLVAIAILITGCSTSTPGPDKTFFSSTVGAGVGAGAGAVVGNQIGRVAEGAGVGAAAGLISGFSSGIMFDSVEKRMIAQNRELEMLKVQNNSNTHQLARLQGKLDRAISADTFGGMYQVFFDVDVTDLKLGSIANLDAIANSIKTSPYAHVINVIGHTDDTGNPEYNERLAEARARSVAASLAAKGVAANQISVSNYGAKRPIASNNTETGRQLNRRVDIFVGNS